MDSAVFDAEDARFVHALAVDGRASLRRIARVLGCSDRSVAQRQRRLRGQVRVVGVVDGARLGAAEWFVRLACSPQVAEAVATALTRRDDTSWVAIVSGGTEIICLLRTHEGVVLDEFSRTPRVHAISAHRQLRPVAGVGGWSRRVSALTGDEVAALAPEPTEPTAVRLADADRALLRALAVDGRTSCPVLARLTSLSESTVRRRLGELRRAGLLRFDVDFDPALLGYRCQATLWLTVRPGALRSVAAALTGHPEIAYAAVTTGTTNLVAFVVLRDVDELHDYLAFRLGALDGVLQVDTAPLTRQRTRAGASPESGGPRNG